MPLMIDAHLDLSWNALGWDRDLTLPLQTLHEQERGMTDSPARGRATVNLDELRRGKVALCFATLLARTKPWRQRRHGHDGGAISTDKRPSVPYRIDLDFNTQAIAYATAHGQLAYYRLLETQGHVRMIRSRAQLDAHWQQWSQPTHPDRPLPVGLILAMEGADPVLSLEQLAQWWDLGLRSLGPVHYGRSTYAVGTGDDGPLPKLGRQLLAAMDRLGMILDVTHLSETSMAEALDGFAGQVIASHHNCRALVPGDRQLSDSQIHRLLARDAVIGVALDAWMLHRDWQPGQSSTQKVSLDNVADHIDHICQLAGNSRHVALGSDLDGGFGTEQTPEDLHTIADLQKLKPILARRGYDDPQIDAIFHGNWLRLLRQTLPA